MFCNTKSFLLKERALVMEDAREFWVSPPLDVNENFNSLGGLGGSTDPVSANLLISSSINSVGAGAGAGAGAEDGVWIGCSGSILSEKLLRRWL